MLWKTLTDISHTLGTRCWFYARAFHFDLGEGRTLAVRPDSMDRVRISVCHSGAERATVWLTTDRQDRLRTIVRDAARDEALTGRT